MKLKIFAPKVLFMAGEEEEELIQVETNTHKDSASVVTMASVCRGLMEKGLFKRAIVVHLATSERNRLEPENWGIITNVEPKHAQPLTVWFAGRMTAMKTDGSDLVVIYPGLTSKKLEEQLANEAHKLR